MLSVCMFSFASLIKVSKREKGVNIFDICFFSNILSIIASLAYSLITGQGYSVPKELRCSLVIRSVVGIVGLLCFTLAATLVPITIQMTVGNLAPFFASIMAFFYANEKMSMLEIAAMCISFGAVVMVAMA